MLPSRPADAFDQTEQHRIRDAGEDHGHPAVGRLFRRERRRRTARGDDNGDALGNQIAQLLFGTSQRLVASPFGDDFEVLRSRGLLHAGLECPVVLIE